MTTDHCMQGGATGFNNSKVIWCCGAGCSTFLQVYFELCWWLNIATVAELTIPENQRIYSRFSLKDSPESSKHETSFSTFFDALSQADVSIFKMEKISRKKVRRERIVVASQNIASKVVRAFVVFHTHARGQSTISCPHLAVFAGFSSLSARNSINGQSVSPPFHHLLRSWPTCILSDQGTPVHFYLPPSPRPWN